MSSILSPEPTALLLPAPRRSDELVDWDPNDPDSWDPAVAWRTLSITTYNLTLAFITWYVVSALVVRLPNAGFALSTGQLFWLTAMPGLAAGVLRMVWTFLPPLLGTRRLVTFSSLLLLVPLVGWGFAVTSTGTPYGVFLVLAFLAGIGGGVFSGFMPSTSYFFPKAKQGTALGLQAGLGNLGVSIVQFVTPWVIGFALLGSLLGADQTFTPKDGAATQVWLQNAAFVWVPFVLVGAALAWRYLKTVPVKANLRQQMDIFGDKHTWFMTSIYLMTFGAFSGFAATFALLIKDVYGGFENAPDPLTYAFLGPLVGATVRMAWGPLTDRFGGAVWTTVSGLGVAAAAIFVTLHLTPDSRDQFTPFLLGMIAVFFFTGIGNASTFKQMPMIFSARQAGGVLGWTAAIAAFGPFLFSVSLGAVIGATGNAKAFFYVVAVFALANVALNWFYYQRKGCEKPC
jgi:NNP family nitrate/nitrite transporter-like MFS transporter